jgi:hypothetical protein
MSQVPVRFIVGELTQEEVDALNDGREVISKIILSYEDFKLFNYHEGDTIEVETEHGYRVLCKILSLEIVKNSEGLIIIFKLQQSKKN